MVFKAIFIIIPSLVSVLMYKSSLISIRIHLYVYTGIKPATSISVLKFNVCKSGPTCMKTYMYMYSQCSIATYHSDTR